MTLLLAAVAALATAPLTDLKLGMTIDEARKHCPLESSPFAEERPHVTRLLCSDARYAGRHALATLVFYEGKLDALKFELLERRPGLRQAMEQQLGKASPSGYSRDEAQVELSVEFTAGRNQVRLTDRESQLEQTRRQVVLCTSEANQLRSEEASRAVSAKTFAHARGEPPEKVDEAARLAKTTGDRQRRYAHCGPPTSWAPADGPVERATTWFYALGTGGDLGGIHTKVVEHRVRSLAAAT